MNKRTLVNLIYQQTIALVTSVEGCLAPPSAAKGRIIQRLGLTPDFISASIPAELEPYIEEYWRLAYRFICDEQRFLRKMIDDLYFEDDTRAQVEANRVLEYLDSYIGLFHETAGLMGYEIK